MKEILIELINLQKEINPILYEKNLIYVNNLNQKMKKK